MGFAFAFCVAQLAAFAAVTMVHDRRAGHLDFGNYRLCEMRLRRSPGRRALPGGWQGALAGGLVWGGVHAGPALRTYGRALATEMRLAAQGGTLYSDAGALEPLARALRRALQGEAETASSSGQTTAGEVNYERVGEGVSIWTARDGRVFTSQAEYVAYERWLFRQSRTLALPAAEIDAPQNRGLTWTTESTGKGSAAKAWEDSVPGATSDVASQRRNVPALRYDNPNPAGEPVVRFDGVDPANSKILIDRKWGVTTKTQQVEKFKNGPLKALEQNPDYRLRIEVPNRKAEVDARRLLRYATGSDTTLKLTS